jgi:hypothetical protein
MSEISTTPLYVSLLRRTPENERHHARLPPRHALKPEEFRAAVSLVFCRLSCRSSSAPKIDNDVAR